MGIKLFYLNFWVLKKITFWNTINGRRIQKGATYGMGFSFFFVGANPPKLDDGWPESEKDVFQAALSMVVVKNSRWMVGEFYMSYGGVSCEK